VNYTDDLFETLRLQDNLQAKYSGGTVLHFFLGEQVRDIEVLKGLIRKISNNYRLPYFTLTPTFSVCPSHGYLSGEHEKCTTCNKETEVYSRVVGYLRPVKQWNDGKRAEFNLRKTYKTEETSPGHISSESTRATGILKEPATEFDSGTKGGYQEQRL